MISFAYCLLASLAVLTKAYVVPYQYGTTKFWPLPSEDAFYQVAPDFHAYAPGDIYDYRPTPFPLGAFGESLESIQENYQISYRTTDSNNNPTLTVMTVLVPQNPDYSKVLSFQIAEDTATVDCAPSFGLQLIPGVDDKLRSGATQLQVWLIQAALAKGWIVVVPDFQGPKGAYAAGKLAGYAVLDGIRATLKSGFLTGIKEDAKVVMWGYSGGGGVTQVAASYQPTYAPELKIAGAAYGGVAGSGADPLTLNKSPDAGLLPASMLGLATMHPDIEQLLDHSIKPEFKELFFSPRKQCLESNLDAFRNKDVIGMFKNGTFEAVAAAVAKALVEENQGMTTPTIPMFLYQAVEDTISPIETVDALVNEICDAGAVVDYLKNEAPSVNHQNYGLLGAPAALDWMKAIMADEREQSACRTAVYNVTTFDPDFLALYPKKIRQGLLGLVPK
ncbi:Lipase A [Cladobotryum mycophilum]|uniref:Lipase A n=1 Tax=Cladobotryum mycophilum TaxID=491253 RepID=A0ABR0SQY7_9HYPO